mgnify:FL=1
MSFQKATKKRAKLKITLNGPAGAGKTYGALVIARELGSVKTALIDSEHGRASLYADKFRFDSSELEEFSLDTYIKEIRSAAAGGYDTLVIDSLSHAWSGRGGALEEVDKRGGSNKFSNGWKAVTPKQNELIDTIRAYPGHVICTMRKKMDYVMEQDDRGRAVPKKVGLAPVQRDGVEYELDFIFDIDIDGTIRVSKTTYDGLANAVLARAELPKAIERIRAWLDDGTPGPEKPMPQPAEVVKFEKGGTASGDKPTDWSPDGAPDSPVTKLEVRFAEAQSKADLDALVAEVRKLPKASQEELRAAFGAARARISNGGAP